MIYVRAQEDPEEDPEEEEEAQRLSIFFSSKRIRIRINKNRWSFIYCSIHRQTPAPHHTLSANRLIAS